MSEKGSIVTLLDLVLAGALGVALAVNVILRSEIDRLTR